MSKLKILIETSLDEGSKVITYYKKLLKDVKSVNKSFEYQNIVLHNYATSSHNVEDRYNEIIINVTESMGLKFEDLRTSPVFSHLPSILDVSTWPLKDGINFFGETAINDLSDCFEDLLKKNGCDVDALNPKCMTLKTHMVPLIKNNQKEHYINIWQRVMKSESIVNHCSNILRIIKILLCTPFSNVKLKRMFSRMAQVKTDYRNRLGRTLLDVCLRVSENGVELSCYDPDPAIDQWFAKKVRRISCSSHNYLSKRNVANKSRESTSVVDIATIAISDLENSDEEFTAFESCFDYID